MDIPQHILNQTFQNLSFFTRDTTLSEQLISVYRAGQIIMERGFVDMSATLDGIAGNLRYLIAASNAKSLSVINPEAAMYHQAMLASGTLFKVLDIVQQEKKTQILLLEINADTVHYFSSSLTNLEIDLIQNGRAIFETSLELPVHPPLESPDWKERTAFPLGMDGAGNFFFKGG